MTLYLHRADRADHLADALAELLLVPLPDPFAEELVVVPARGIERWLTQRLSHRLGVGPHGGDGVCAGVRFVSPRSLVSLLLDRERDDPWDPDRLVWPLLRVIDDALAGPDVSWCRALAVHLGFGLTGEEAELRRDRRYAVGRRLAGLFASYAVQRPSLVTDWWAGRDTDGTGRPLDDDLRWQPELWRRLVAAVDKTTPDERQRQTVAAMEAGADLALPSRLSLFGHTRLPGTEVELLGAVARHRDVHLWLPQVSGELWERLAPVVAAGPCRRTQDDTARSVGHPLLASLGRDARELQRGLAILPDVVDRTGVTDRTEGTGPTTLLGLLQADLRADHEPDAAERAARTIGADDRSVRVQACHGPTRQVDVLREVLVGLLQDDPTLEPRDIVVMCPDIDAYAPLVQAGFGLAEAEGAAGHPAHRLRVRLADRGLAFTNPLLALARRLVELAGARVTATEVLDLAAEEPVRHRFGFSQDDLGQLARWVESAGIRWGFDAAHRTAYHLADVTQNSWLAGLDRLLLGVAMAEYAHRWLAGTLPVDDVAGNDIGLVGRFAELVTRLRSAVDRLLDSDPEVDLVETLRTQVLVLASVPERDAWQLAQFEREIAAMAPEDGGALRLADLRGLLDQRLGGRPTRANFRTGTLTVCTMVPMRSVPHRVVCLLGLDDGVFPRTPSVDGDDVLARDPVTGERDARSEDRQLLLDAVLAATETLVVTYSGASEHTGQIRPPAVPVGELLDALDATVATPVRDRILVRHPLQQFDPRNLTPGALGTPGPFSFDASALSGAEQAAGGQHPRPTFLPQPLAAARPAPDVTLEELRGFFTGPARAFLRGRLDLAVPQQPRDADEHADDIPIEPNALQRWAIGNRVLARLVAGEPMDSVCTAEVLRGEVPPGGLGHRVLRDVLAPVDAMLKATAAERASEPESVDVALDLGRRRLTGGVGDVYAGGIVRLSYSALSAKQRLPSWIDLLALVASGPGRTVSAATYAKDKAAVACSRLTITDADEARSHLLDLLDVFDRGMCEPLPLPLRTGCAFAESAQTGHLKNAENRARAAWLSDPNNDNRPPGEQDEPAHVLVYGPHAPLEVLLGHPRRDESWSKAPHRLGQYAWRVWHPLLCHEGISR